MIQHTRLMRTEHPPARFIPDMPPMAREENLRVGIENVCHRSSNHGAKYVAINLICQIKVNNHAKSGRLGAPRAGRIIMGVAGRAKTGQRGALKTGQCFDAYTSSVWFHATFH
jgi:hypothetical protein